MGEGTYRIRHAGKYKHWLVGLTSYEGSTNNFVVENLKLKPKLHPKVSMQVNYLLNDNTNSGAQETSTLTKKNPPSPSAKSTASSLKTFHIYSSLLKLFGLL